MLLISLNMLKAERVAGNTRAQASIGRIHEWMRKNKYGTAYIPDAS
jgi:hypothetical protein